MKKLLKIIGFIILSFLTIVIVLFVVAVLSQDKIFEITQKKIGNSIHAEVLIEDFSLTLLKRFPYATLELSGVKIAPEKKVDPQNPKAVKNEIIEIERVYVSVQSVPLFKGIYEIEHLEIDGAFVYYTIDSVGNSNIDFLLQTSENTNESSTETGDSTAMYISFENVKIKNTTLRYSNDTLPFTAKIYVPSLDIKGKYENEVLKVGLDGEVNLSEMDFPETNLNRMKEATLGFDVTYASDTIKIKALDARTEGTEISATGWIGFTEQLFADLKFKITNTELGEMANYLPDNLLESYGFQNISGNIEMSGNMKGWITDSILPAVNFNYDLKNGLIQTRDYPAIQKLNLNGQYSSPDAGNLQKAQTILDKLYAETAKSSLELSGSFSDFENLNYNLKTRINIELDEFAAFVPDSVAKKISGKLSGNITSKGRLPEQFDEKYINQVAENSSADLHLQDLTLVTDSLTIEDFSGKVHYSPGKIRVDNLAFMVPQYNVQMQNAAAETDFWGKITKPEELKLKVKSFYAELPQGTFQGEAEIENPENPTFDLNLLANVKLAELKPFIPDSLVKKISGEIIAKIVSKGRINFDSIEYQANNILFNQSDVQIEARNVSAVLPDSIQNIHNLNGAVFMKNGNLSIHKISGITSDIPFSIDTAEIFNIYTTILENKKDTLSAYLDLKVGALDYSVFAPFFATDSTALTRQSEENPDNITFASTEDENSSAWERNFAVNLKGKIKVESFLYDKVFLDDISAKFHLTDSVYIIDQFKTKAFDGNTVNSLRYVLSNNNKQIIYIKSKIENMDVNKLLYGFDDFGYDSLISYKNLSGIFTSDINSRFVFVNDTLVTNDMRVLGQFKLKNGKLVNYQPAMDVSKFTGIKELDNIEMKTLDCNIFMFKNQLFVPITNIVSTSLDVSTFGMQSMDENYEYHLHLKLGEILRGKSQKLIEQQSKIGDEVPGDDMDKNTIKIIYGYNNGKKRIGFATRREQKMMELKIKTQQKMLELIFHPLLVSYETGVQ